MVNVIQQVADRAGVSRATVSKILNKKDLRFKEQTLLQVRQAAEDLGYRPNAMAQALALRRTKTIGVLFNWAGPETVANLYSIGVLNGIVAGAATAGYQVLLYTEQWKNAAASSAFFSSSHTDGIILVAPTMDQDIVPAFAALGILTIILGAVSNAPGTPYLHVDNATGVILALDHLWSLGHRSIAYLGYGHDQQSDMADRYKAYGKWMIAHDLSFQKDNIVTDLNRHVGSIRVERLEAWLRLPDRPSAIFCVTDEIAADVLEAARNVGISVPNELSVVGFDDGLIASLTQPKLTTVRQPLFQMGQQSSRLLIEQIEEKGGSAEQLTGHIAVPELIVRGSTAAVKT